MYNVTCQKVKLIKEVEDKLSKHGDTKAVEAIAARNTRILAIIFNGVLRLLLNEIEDARRDHTLPLIPQLAALIQHLSAGGM